MPKFSKKQGCEETREQLSAHIDGQLTSEEKGSLEEHLASCKPCQQELESLRATKNVLSLMPSVATPRSFLLVVEQPARRPAFGFLRLATAVAAVLLILVQIGDFWSVYPKAPVPVVTPPVVVAPAPTATAAPVIPATPPGTQPPPVGRPGDVPILPVTPSVPGGPGPANPAVTPGVPDIGAPQDPNPAQPGAGTAAAQPTSGEYLWPVRQVEQGLLVLVLVLFVLTVAVRQWALARARSSRRK